MKQTEIAKELGVSKSYISMVLAGKKKPSKRVANALCMLKVNLEMVNSESNFPILSHACLPVPALPRNAGA